MNLAAAPVNVAIREGCVQSQRVIRPASRAPADRLGALVFVGVVWLGWTGAARSPDGLVLGASEPLAAVALLAALAGGMRPPANSRLGLGLLPFLFAPLLAPWWPALGAWSGPPLLVGGLAALLLWRMPVLPLRLLLPLAAVLYAGAAVRVQSQVGAEGDEPHYLMVSDSLLRDHDLRLEEDYAERRYAAFVRKPTLEPHFRVRGKGGEIYSLHALGLSLWLLPAYALGGYPLASLFQAGLGVLLIAQIRGLTEDWLGDAAVASQTALVLAFSAPLVHYAGLIFTEVPAALLLTTGLRLAASASLRPRAALLLGLCAGLLPWLNVRYAVLSLLLGAYALRSRPPVRSLVFAGSVVAVSAVALLLYHQALYGFFDPRRVYGTQPEFALGSLLEGLPGLLFDQEFGLFVYAPGFVLAVPGMALLWRKDRAAALVSLGLIASALFLAGSWHMWRGGFNPPARFLVPVVPVLGVAVACVLRRGLHPASALLIAWGLWTGIGGALEPRLVHRDRDGTAPFFREHAGAQEWTPLLPGFVLSDPDRAPLVLLWGATLALAAGGALVGRVTARGLALSCAAAVCAAAGAAPLSHARTGGRDATRLVPREGSAWPQLRVEKSARWTTLDLAWGPTYEPHRHPSGALVGERLRIPSGKYALEIRGVVLGDEIPRLVAQRDADAVPAPGAPCQRTDLGITCAFTAPGEAVNLLVTGGPTIQVRELRLTPQL